jgi:photosystem II stability/assembly factor-like uncharacterized protein
VQFLTISILIWHLSTWLLVRNQNFMKRLSIIALSIILLGAGCLGSSSEPNSADAGVFKSFTSGEEWVQSVLVPTAMGIGTLATTNVLDITMDPQDNNFLYISTRGNGMLYSEDAGASWRQPRDEALQTGTVNQVTVDPRDVCTVYVAVSSRLLRSDDCMRTFDSETYVDNRGVNVVRVAVDWYNNRNVWIGLSNGDVLKSEDSGNTWRTILNTGNSITGFLISRTDSRQTLVSTSGGGIHKTDNGGDNWKSLSESMSKFSSADKVYNLIQSEDSGVVIAATGYGILRSENFGESWKAVDLITSPGQVQIRAVGMNESNPNTLYYAANSTFYRSLDAGTTWETERIHSGRTPTMMLVDPTDPSVLYVAVAYFDD